MLHARVRQRAVLEKNTTHEKKEENMVVEDRISRDPRAASVRYSTSISIHITLFISRNHVPIRRPHMTHYSQALLALTYCSLSYSIEDQSRPACFLAIG